MFRVPRSGRGGPTHCSPGHSSLGVVWGSVLQEPQNKVRNWSRTKPPRDFTLQMVKGG